MPPRIKTSRSFPKHSLPVRSELWEQQRDEPAEVYAAFRIYCDIPSEKKRSCSVVAEESGEPNDTVEQWADEWNWAERACAYDNYLIKIEIDELKRDRVKSIRKHVALARAFQNKVITRLNALNPDELSPGDLVKWIEVAGKIEKQALNEPVNDTQTTETRSKIY